jgi:two-component system response regulator ChvI
MNEGFHGGGHEQDIIRFVFIDEDAKYLENFCKKLSRWGFLFQNFRDGAALLAALESDPEAPVIVLTWQLPNAWGDVLSQLRQRGIIVPLVFLTDQALLDGERLALASGPLDLVDKAHGVEGRARRASRIVGNSTADVETEPRRESRLRLRSDIGRAYWDDAKLDLTAAEYNVVSLLASNAGHYCTYRSIYDRLHSEDLVPRRGTESYRANVRTAIKRIRNKFRALDPAFNQIENYNSFGYCWMR